MSPHLCTRRLGVAGSSLLAALLTACSWPGVEEEPLPLPTRPDAAPRGQRVAQLGFQGDAAFAVCTPPHCPSVTAKTLAVTGPPSAAPEPGPAEPAPPVRPVTVATPTTDTPSELPPPVVAPPPTPRRLTLQFGLNSADLTESHRAQLQQALHELRQVERLVISGRTDNQGSERLNQALAVSRALAIRQHLLDLAPDLPARIEIDARGRCCYVATNADEDGRARNRRVELVYTLPTARS